MLGEQFDRAARFLERQIKIVLEVGPAFGPGAPARLAEKIFENIVEDVAEAALPAEVESFRSLRSAGVAKGIVSPPLVLIADDLIGLIDLFEFFFG